MGPRFGALGVPESLLPWRDAGVRYLLRVDDPAEAGAEVAATAPESAPQDWQGADQPDAFAGEQGESQSDGYHGAAGEHPDLRRAPSVSTNSSVRPPHQERMSAHGAGDSSAGAGRYGSASASPASTPDAVASRGIPPRPDHFARSGEAPAASAQISTPQAGEGGGWPAPWDAFMAKTCQPCLVLFTYLELGLDLGGQPSAARRGLFADIIGALRNKAGWPRGCVSFWPLGVPSAEAPSGVAVDTDAFWRGVRSIKPRFVCIFGRAAWQTLYPGRRFIIGPLRVSGHSLLVLPGPEEMLPDNKQVKGVVWNSLRSLGIAE